LFLFSDDSIILCDGDFDMLYRVKIKIRVNSTITNMIVEVPATYAVIAMALVEQMYGTSESEARTMGPEQ